VNRCTCNHSYKAGSDALILLYAVAHDNREGAKAIMRCAPCLWCLTAATAGTAAAFLDRATGDVAGYMENVIDQVASDVLARMTGEAA